MDGQASRFLEMTTFARHEGAGCAGKGAQQAYERSDSNMQVNRRPA